MGDLVREVRFEPGYDCIRFECVNGSKDCAPEKGGSHGVHGLQIRWLVKGTKGAVQFLVYTGWLPEPERWSVLEALMQKGRIIPAMAADLGYHSPTPRYEGQSAMDKCDVLPQGFCYYDGSGLNAAEPWRVLCSHGGEALWEYLEGYYAQVFEEGPEPVEKPYRLKRRTP